ncbi:hypothetical protein PTKIN_Ptkin01aG0139100 [Pterospermum kingtungense]
MNYFKFFEGLCKEINSILAGFWRGDRSSKRRIHWKKWNELCWSKADGVWVLRSLIVLISVFLPSNGGDFCDGRIF